MSPAEFRGLAIGQERSLWLEDIGLVGFVQNRPDGRVLVIAEGEERDYLEWFASALEFENGIIDVEDVSAEYSHGSGAYTVFKKITGPHEFGERLDDAIGILKEIAAGLDDLIEVYKNGFEKINSTMDKYLNKDDQVPGKQGQMI